MACDEILYDSTWDVLHWCSSSQLFNYKNDEIVSNFISTLDNWDIVYVEDKIVRNGCWWYCTYNIYSIRVCFSSSSVWSTMCFVGDKSTYESEAYWSKTPFLRSSLLTWRSNFSNISLSLLSDPPWFSNNIEWWSSIWNNVSLTWNLMYNSCTKWYILNKLDWILWDQFCYAWTYDTWLIDNNFNWNTYIYDYWLNYRDLYKLSKSIGPYYSSYNDWYLWHYDSIKRYKLWQISQNPFIWEPVAVYSYFNNLYSNYWIDVADLSTKEMSSYWVLNYCNLLFSDSSNSSAYTWQYFQYLCDSLNSQDWSIDVTTWIIGDPDESFEVLPPWFEYSNNPSSWMIVSVDWSWTLSWNTDNNFEWRTFINDFYQKLQSVFQKPTKNIVWIVPWYILVFMVAIILFRFLSH